MLNKNRLESLLKENGINNLDIKQVDIKHRKVPHSEVLKYYNSLSDFIQFVEGNYGKLLHSLGIPADTMNKMVDGIISPNIAVRLKIPLEWGGQVEFSNMVLLQSHPVGDIIDQFYIRQVADGVGENNTVIVPQSLFVIDTDRPFIISSSSGSFSPMGGLAVDNEHKSDGNFL
ncbi:MAG: hypothetical protein JJV93_02215 [Alphaproteobacteria bacterium]|nr:hypothetical protein [Alphaproteobacteria bacterium]MBL0718053.1 hypothetical protein [Alphaproteobacteria bacterium]